MKSICRSSGASLAKAGLTGVLITTGALLVGCTAPDPNTPAGQSEIAGQKCTECIVGNPRDASPCQAIRSQRVEDQAAYQKAVGR